MGRRTAPRLNASSLAFIGTVLGATTNRKWLLLPATVLAFLFQHAVQGSKDRFMVNSPVKGAFRITRQAVRGPADVFVRADQYGAVFGHAAQFRPVAV